MVAGHVALQLRNSTWLVFTLEEQDFTVVLRSAPQDADIKCLGVTHRWGLSEMASLPRRRRWRKWAYFVEKLVLDRRALG